MGLSDLQEIWSNYGFEIVLGSCVLFIVIYAFYRWIKGCKGTWARSYTLQDSYKPIVETGYKKVQTIQKESKGEVECRRVLERIFNKPFSKYRPAFLRNPVTSGNNSNFNLEIDCYNDELKLGCEYDGIQHYKYTPYFHKNNEAFLNQKYRDELKKRMCKDVDVMLITVPYTVKIPDIEQYILNQLRINGFNI